MKSALFKCFAGLLLSASCTVVFPYPTKPVTIVVPAPPGGTADTVMRFVSARLAIDLGQPIVIENKPGAGGVIAAQYVAGAPADGYTLLMNYTSHAINPWLMTRLPYDTVSSFVSVAMLGTVPLLLAVPASGQKSAAALIADAHANPGTLSYGTSATGGASHLGGELFSQLTGGKLLMVPYKGGAAAAADLAAGRISMLLDTKLALAPLQQANRIRFLGIASEKRSAVFPELEPIGQLLPGFEATAWYGIVAPAGTPAPVVEQLNAEINRVLQDPAISQPLIEQGFEPQAVTSAAWGRFMDQETKRWGALIQKASLKAE